MGLGPVPCNAKKCQKKLNLNIEDIDLFEMNEAFAAQSIAVTRLLNLDVTKVNTRGGAIALGHPIGASGCRVLVTLVHALINDNKRKKDYAHFVQVEVKVSLWLFLENNYRVYTNICSCRKSQMPCELVIYKNNCLLAKKVLEQISDYF